MSNSPNLETSGAVCLAKPELHPHLLCHIQWRICSNNRGRGCWEYQLPGHSIKHSFTWAFPLFSLGQKCLCLIFYILSISDNLSFWWDYNLSVVRNHIFSLLLCSFSCTLNIGLQDVLSNCDNCLEYPRNHNLIFTIHLWVLHSLFRLLNMMFFFMSWDAQGVLILFNISLIQIWGEW